MSLASLQAFLCVSLVEEPFWMSIFYRNKMGLNGKYFIPTPALFPDQQQTVPFL